MIAWKKKKRGGGLMKAYAFGTKEELERVQEDIKNIGLAEKESLIRSKGWKKALIMSEEGELILEGWYFDQWDLHGGVRGLDQAYFKETQQHRLREA